jgi:hypothetical protein
MLLHKHLDSNGEEHIFKTHGGSMSSSSGTKLGNLDGLDIDLLGIFEVLNA